MFLVGLVGLMGLMVLTTLSLLCLVHNSTLYSPQVVSKLFQKGLYFCHTALKWCPSVVHVAPKYCQKVSIYVSIWPRYDLAAVTSWDGYERA